MKKETIKISANEINRFVYCPYQWYYKKVYGAGNLQKMYKELDRPISKHESHFVRGSKYHSRYYFRYRLMKGVKIGLVILIIGIIILWGWQRWVTG